MSDLCQGIDHSGNDPTRKDSTPAGCMPAFSMSARATLGRLVLAMVCLCTVVVVPSPLAKPTAAHGIAMPRPIKEAGGTPTWSLEIGGVVLAPALGLAAPLADCSPAPAPPAAAPPELPGAADPASSPPAGAAETVPWLALGRVSEGACWAVASAASASAVVAETRRYASHAKDSRMRVRLAPLTCTQPSEDSLVVCLVKEVRLGNLSVAARMVVRVCLPLSEMCAGQGCSCTAAERQAAKR